MILQLYHNDTWSDVDLEKLPDLTQVVTSQASGLLRWSIEAEVDEAFQFTKDDVIGLRGRDSETDDWTVLFFGSLLDEPKRAYISNYAIDSCVAFDAWRELERVTYQTDEFVAEGFNKSHLILFRDADGERMTTGEQIKAALDYAIDKGVQIDYESSDLDNLDVQPPSDEQTGLTISEIIKRCLRWQPGYFTFFEYGVDGSTLRILSDTDAVDVVIPLSSALKRRFSAVKNDQMAVPGVIVNYEIENEIIDGTTQEIQTDEAGDTTHPNVLPHTFQIDGSYLQNDQAEITIETEEIPSDWETNLSFVQTFFPYVCDLSGWAGYPASPTSLAHNDYITSGYQDGYGVVSVPTELRWHCRWVQTMAGLIVGSPGYLCNILDGVDYLNYEWVNGWVSITLNLTSSAAGTFSQDTPIVVAGEEIPVGVAAALYAGMRYPLHSGQISRDIESVATLTDARNNLKVTGGLADLATMRAPAQEVTRDWFSLVEAVKFGYPEQAGISNYIDHLRSNRMVNRPSRRTWRTE